MTTISDHVTYADGRPANGQVTVSWPAFQVGGLSVAGGQQTWPIVDGVVSVSVYANINAAPLGMYYTALYELDEGALYPEYWMVPDIADVNLGQIKVNQPVTPSVMINANQLTSAGASYGQFLGWNGSRWVPMYVSSSNLQPNSVGLMVTAAPGSDLSVGGSPAMLGGDLVLNVPDAGAAARGVVTTGPQTFAGAKTFQATATFSGGITVAAGSTIAGYVPTTTQVRSGYGLTGGGALVGDVTLAVADNTSRQKVTVNRSAVAVGTRATLNFLPGANVALAIADNAALDQIDLTISSSGGGTGSVPPGTAVGDTLFWQDTPAPGFWATLAKGAAGQVLTAGAAGLGWAPAEPPGTNTGDVLIWNSTSAAWTVLARGTAGQLLTAGSSTISWAAPPVPVPPGTTTGDILIWNGAWTVLPRGAANRVLTAGASSVSWVAPTPWTSDVSGGGYQLTNIGAVAVNKASASYTLDVGGDINATGAVRVNGVPLAQTPWLQDVDGRGYRLFSVGLAGFGTATPTEALEVNGALYLNSVFPRIKFHVTAPTPSLVTPILAMDGRSNLLFDIPAASAPGFPADGGGLFYGQFILSTGGTGRVNVAQSGNVGVGTSFPAYNLDVAGDVNCTGVYRVNGTPVSGGGVTVWRSNAGAGGAAAILPVRSFTGSPQTAGPYQNTTGKPLFVDVSVATNSIPSTLNATTGSTSGNLSTAATTLIMGTGANVSLSFWVLPNYWYAVSMSLGAASLAAWSEWY